MKLPSISLLSVLLALLLLSSTSSSDALTINATQVATVEDVRSDSQLLEKTWTVQSIEQLRSLQLQVPGRVFVEYDASSLNASYLSSSGVEGEVVVATIVTTGDNSELIDLLEVVPDTEGDEDAIKLRLARPNGRVSGYLLTQIFLRAKNIVHDVSTVGSSDIVIGDDVLIRNDPDAKLSFSVTGSGDLYVPSSAGFVLGALEISVAGSGDVQVGAPSITTVDSLALFTFGSGDVAVVADTITTDEVIASVAGSGDSFIQTNNLTVTNLNANIAGSGDVSYAVAGTCVNESIAVAGPGDVFAGSIACANADVDIIGSGKVFVQAIEELKASVFASGVVKYVGERPKFVQVSGLSFGKKSKHKIKAANRNKFKEYRPHALPPREPAFVRVKPSSIPWKFQEGSAKIRVDGDNVEISTPTNLASSYLAMSSSNPSGLAVVALVGTALVAVGVAVHKYSYYRTRQQYAPLV